VIVGLVIVVAASSLGNTLNDVGLGSFTGATNVGIALGLVIMAIAITMIVLAAKTLRGSDGCRIASAVMQIIFGVLWLLGVAPSLTDNANAGFPLLFLLSCVAVVWLLFTSSATAATRAS